MLRPLQTQTHTQARDAPNRAKKSPKPHPASSKTLPWAPQHSPKPVNRFQNGSKRAQKSSWAPRNGFQHMFSRTHGKSCETSTVDSVLKKKLTCRQPCLFFKTMALWGNSNKLLHIPQICIPRQLQVHIGSPVSSVRSPVPGPQSPVSGPRSPVPGLRSSVPGLGSPDPENSQTKC